MVEIPVVVGSSGRFASTNTGCSGKSYCHCIWWRCDKSEIRNHVDNSSKFLIMIEGEGGFSPDELTRARLSVHVYTHR